VDLSEEKYSRDFRLLAKLVQSVEDLEWPAELTTLQRFITDEILVFLKDDAPPNIAELIFGFEYELERLQSFIAYNKLSTRNIVALGGAFSSGKSSFLNALYRKKMLPSSLAPTTSVPTYIIGGPELSVHAVNVFDHQMSLEFSELLRISHDFTVTHEVSLAHLLQHIYIEVPEHRYRNIAFLDTPGYSKPEDETYSKNTDEQLARTQLNASNYIVWFVDVEAGSMKDADFEFLKTIRQDIPILIVVNKCDKKEKQEVLQIVEHIKASLAQKGLLVEGVVPFSCRKPQLFDLFAITNYFDMWEKKPIELKFAWNFKIIFTSCLNYYDDMLRLERKRLNRLNSALTLSENEELNAYLNSLTEEIKIRIRTYKEKLEKLLELKNTFFTLLKEIGETSGIPLPEPKDIDLIADKIRSPYEVIKEYKQKHSIKDTDYNHLLAAVFQNYDSKAYHRSQGSAGSPTAMADAIQQTLSNVNATPFRQAAGGAESAQSLNDTVRLAETKTKSPKKSI